MAKPSELIKNWDDIFAIMFWENSIYGSGYYIKSSLFIIIKSILLLSFYYLRLFIGIICVGSILWLERILRSKVYWSIWKIPGEYDYCLPAIGISRLYAKPIIIIKSIFYTPLNKVKL